MTKSTTNATALAWLDELKAEVNAIWLPEEKKETKKLKIWLRGSPFQLRVWEALLSLPVGTHCTYGQLASFSGHAGASRATGSAIGRNPVSWLIPCHRVITSLGTMGGYRWGTYTKQAIIGYEAATSSIHCTSALSTL